MAAVQATWRGLAPLALAPGFDWLAFQSAIARRGMKTNRVLIRRQTW